MKLRTSLLNLSLSLGALVVAGCATPTPPSDVSKTYDPATGFRTDLMDNPLAGPEQPREVIWLNATRFAKDASKYIYYLQVRYLAKEQVGYLEIPPGNTLTIQTDQQTLKLGGTGSLHRTTEEGFVRETALYETAPEHLRQIAGARRVVVSVKGNKGLVEREFTAENTERFQKFVHNTIGL